VDMSTNSSSLTTLDASDIGLQSDFLVLNYCDLAAFVVLIYDISLTLDDEVKYIWRGRLSFMSIAYLLARYICLLELALVLVGNFINTSDEACTSLEYTYNTVFLLFALGMYGLIFGKAYAVAYRERLLLGLLSIPLAGFLIIQALFIYTSPCDVDFDFKTLDALNDVFILLSDIGATIITIRATWGLHLLRRKSGEDSSRPTLLSLFYQQGIINFCIISSWNVELIVVTKIIRPSLSDFDGNLISAVSSILLCRFLLLVRRQYNNNCRDTEDLRAPPIGTFHAAMRRVSDSVIADFGERSLPALPYSGKSLPALPYSRRMTAHSLRTV